MKNRFVRLLRMGLPGLVLAALAGCAAPVGPEETSAPETQVYTCLLYTSDAADE